MTMTTAPTDVLETTARVRAVAPPDAPFEGRLARGVDGATRFLVDRAVLVDWPGWSASAGGHVLAPLDVTRRSDGHDVILPRIVERVDRFLARRAGIGVPLSDGERVTLAVSLLRGLAQCRVRGTADEPAEWWLDDDGRPVVVEGVGDLTCATTTADALSALVAEPPTTRLDAELTRAAEHGARPRVRASHLEESEDALVACARAEPLITEPLTPQAPVPAHVSRAVGAEEPPRTAWWHRIPFLIDGGVAQWISDTVAFPRRRVRTGARSAPRGRRRAVLWACAVAAAVLAGGLVWPTSSSGGDTVVAAPSPSAEPVAPTGAAGPGAPSPTTPDAESGDDPVAALGRLLDRLRECPDGTCEPEIREDPSAPLPDGAIRASPEERSLVLVDDFGGLAVVRVEQAGVHPPQIVTVVRVAERWRVRDVFDVADPPS